LGTPAIALTKPESILKFINYNSFFEFVLLNIFSQSNSFDACPPIPAFKGTCSLGASLDIYPNGQLCRDFLYTELLHISGKAIVRNCTVPSQKHFCVQCCLPGLAPGGKLCSTYPSTLLHLSIYIRYLNIERLYKHSIKYKEVNIVTAEVILMGYPVVYQPITDWF